VYGGQYFSTPRKDARAPAALLIDKDHPTSRGDARLDPIVGAGSG